LPSTTFLFWNINRKPLAQVVAELADEHQVDIIVLAESATSAGSLQRELNSGNWALFHLPHGLSRSLTFFTRFSTEFLQPVFESDRVSIRRLALPARSEVLVAAAHLPSKLHWSSESQPYECVELAQRIVDAENRAGHRRTVLLGDFNMNPFESGMVAAGGLNSVMSRAVADRVTRTVQGREYPFFYNPMWGHFGDAKGETAGSYFYDSAEHVNYYWNVFDQVLIRPELAREFDTRTLRILTSVGSRALVR
jgi:hypothetical protein